MEKNIQLINTFYSAFAKGDASTMNSCYHSEVKFEDPAFGQLSGERACKMWEMLLSNEDAAPIITHSNVKATELDGSAEWSAEYFFGPDKRKVINNVKATFAFSDGLIHRHTDVFSMWNWSKQALGVSGLLLGWTPIIRNKVQQTTNKKLSQYIANKT